MLAAASAVVCLVLLLVPPCPAPKSRTKNWQRKLLSPSQIEDRDWWYNKGDVWDTTRQLALRNPFLTAFHRIQKQMDTYGWAQHVGRIADPGLIRGRHATPSGTSPTATCTSSAISPGILQGGGRSLCAEPDKGFSRVGEKGDLLISSCGYGWNWSQTLNLKVLQCEHISLHVVVLGINSLLHFKNISTSSGASSLEVRGATTWTGQGYKGSGKEFLAPVFSKKIRIDKEDVPKNLPEKKPLKSKPRSLACFWVKHNCSCQVGLETTLIVLSLHQTTVFSGKVFMEDLFWRITQML